MSSPTPSSLDELAAEVRLLVLDFDGVLTDNTVWVDQDGRESVRCWRSDGFGLRRLREAGVAVWVVSTETNPVCSRRCEKLGLPVRQGVSDKKAVVGELCRELDVPWQRVAYVGNDVNDLECLGAVGLPIAVQDAYPEVLEAARYRTARPGGFGAVREVCDWIAGCQERGRR